MLFFRACFKKIKKVNAADQTIINLTKPTTIKHTQLSEYPLNNKDDLTDPSLTTISIYDIGWRAKTIDHTYLKIKYDQPISENDLYNIKQLKINGSSLLRLAIRNHDALMVEKIIAQFSKVNHTELTQLLFFNLAHHVKNFNYIIDNSDLANDYYLTIKITNLLDDLGDNSNFKYIRIASQPQFNVETEPKLLIYQKINKILLEAGADINGINCAGKKLIHYLTNAGLCESTSFLLGQKQLNYNSLDVLGQRPISIALNNLDIITVASLIKLSHSLRLMDKDFIKLNTMMQFISSAIDIGQFAICQPLILMLNSLAEVVHEPNNQPWQLKSTLQNYEQHIKPFLIKIAYTMNTEASQSMNSVLNTIKELQIKIELFIDNNKPQIWGISKLTNSSILSNEILLQHIFKQLTLTDVANHQDKNNVSLTSSYQDDVLTCIGGS